MAVLARCGDMAPDLSAAVLDLPNHTHFCRNAVQECLWEQGAVLSLCAFLSEMGAFPAFSVFIYIS